MYAYACVCECVCVTLNVQRFKTAPCLPFHFSAHTCTHTYTHTCTHMHTIMHACVGNTSLTRLIHTSVFTLKQIPSLSNITQTLVQMQVHT